MEMKHKNGSHILFSDNGDIVIHAQKDVVIMSDNFILENPSNKKSSNTIARI